MQASKPNDFFLHFAIFLMSTVVLGVGCGTTTTRKATEQLLVSDAVDNAIATIDFRALSGETVYLNTDFIRNIKGIGFVNADYIISSLRQQVIAANCHLQDNIDDAEYVIEARVGALGSDGNEFTLGISQQDNLTSAASLIPSAPLIPPIPEFSLAKREAQSGTAKIAVFAYHRETRQPVWQSGLSLARSSAKDTWLLGAGPFQSGSIYKGGTHFGGDKLRLNLMERRRQLDRIEGPTISYFGETHFDKPTSPNMQLDSGVQQATFEEDAPSDEPRPLKKDQTNNVRQLEK